MSKSLPSRGAHGAMGAILAGAASAGLFALAFSQGSMLVVFLANLVPLPLFTVGLGAGVGAVTIAGVFATLALTLMANVQIGAIFLLTFALPVAWLVFLALRHRYDEAGHLYWYPTGRLITAATLYACGVFAVLAAMLSGQEGGLQEILRGTFDAMKDAALQQLPPEKLADLNMEHLNASFTMAARLVPAFSMISWILLMIITGLAAHYVLRQQKWALRDTPSFYDLEIPSWMLGLFAITGVLAVLPDGQVGFVALNICIALGVPYFMQGLSVLHVWAGQSKYKIAILIALYLILSFGYPVILVAGLGVLEPWIHLRRRMLSVSRTL